MAECLDTEAAAAFPFASVGGALDARGGNTRTSCFLCPPPPEGADTSAIFWAPFGNEDAGTAISCPLPFCKNTNLCCCCCCCGCCCC